MAEVANSTTAASVLQLPEVIETVLEHVELAACPASVGRAWSTEWTRKTRHVLRHAFLDHGIPNVCGLVTLSSGSLGVIKRVGNEMRIVDQQLGVEHSVSINSSICGVTVNEDALYVSTFEGGGGSSRIDMLRRYQFDGSTFLLAQERTAQAYTASLLCVPSSNALYAIRSNYELPFDEYVTSFDATTLETRFNFAEEEFAEVGCLESIAVHESQIFVACHGKVIVYSPGGERLRTIEAAFGNADKIAFVGEKLCLIESPFDPEDIEPDSPSWMAEAGRRMVILTPAGALLQTYTLPSYGTGVNMCCLRDKLVVHSDRDVLVLAGLV